MLLAIKASGKQDETASVTHRFILAKACHLGANGISIQNTKGVLYDHGQQNNRWFFSSEPKK
jgi:hypothetical protein